MSIELLKSAFESIQYTTDWSLQLLKITISKREGTRYASRQIILEPEGKLDCFVANLAKRYLGSEKGSLSKYIDLREYDGTADGMTIYKLEKDNTLISAEYTDFVAAISDPDVEADPIAFTSAYVIKGSTIVGDEDTPIRLVSMQKPITTFKNKYFLNTNNGNFREFDQNALNLRPTLEVVIIGTTVYFLNMNGENLFNMERAYKSVCHERIEEIEASDMIGGLMEFKAVAKSGHNPRKFVSFNYERFEALKNPETRREMAEQFGIPLDADGKLDATDEKAADHIVKVFCNKGMFDPFNKVPVEVSSSKPW